MMTLRNDPTASPRTPPARASVIARVVSWLTCTCRHYALPGADDRQVEADRVVALAAMDDALVQVAHATGLPRTLISSQRNRASVRSDERSELSATSMGSARLHRLTKTSCSTLSASVRLQRQWLAKDKTAEPWAWSRAQCCSDPPVMVASSAAAADLLRARSRPSAP